MSNCADPTGRGFVRSLAAALFCLLLGGLILVSGYAAYYWYGDGEATAESDPMPRHWGARDMRAVQGSARTEPKAIHVEALNASGQAVLIGPADGFAAADYRYVSYDLTGVTPALDLYFFWRTVDRPGLIQSVPLPWSGDGAATASVFAEDGWEGQVLEVGLAITGDLREPVAVGELALHPRALAPHLRAIWAEWTAFEGWSHSSINFITGGPRDPLIHPAPVAAAWVGLALLLLAGARFARGAPWDWQAAAAIFVAGSLALDGRWLLDLQRQATDTRFRYAGKDLEGKRLAESDGDFFGFIQRIKDALPNRINRVFVVSNQPRGADRFVRLRAHYHLLPQNVNSWLGRLPAPEAVRAGDFVLRLGEETTAAALPAGALPTHAFARRLNVGAEWRSFTYADRISSPVVITGPVATTESGAGVPRLRDISPNGFELSLQPWPYRAATPDGLQASVPVLAVESGHYAEGGMVWEAGTFRADGQGAWQTRSFAEPFPGRPHLFLAVQTGNDLGPVVVRAKDVTRAGFSAALFPEEARENGHGIEQIGYVAIYSGTGAGKVSKGKRERSVRLGRIDVNHRWRGREGIPLRLLEEQSADSEVRHTSETLDTLQLDNLLFAQDTSAHGSDPALSIQGYCTEEVHREEAGALYRVR